MEIKTKSKGFISKSYKTANRNICLRSKKRNRQLSLMLLVNNLFFILSSLPLCSNVIYYNYKAEKGAKYPFQAYFHILSYSNNSFSFILYFIFFKKYKNIIKDKFISRRKNENNQTQRQQNKSNSLLRFEQNASLINNQKSSLMIQEPTTNLFRNDERI